MSLLVLAGTREARQVLWALTETGRPVVASLAGATRRPEPLPVPTRVGGFGGAAGFRAYLAEAGITAVLDATHPFAERISERTARLCAEQGLPYCQVLRPPWQAGAGDAWTRVAAPEDVARAAGAARVVFLATGGGALDRYAGLAGRRVIARQIDPPTAPFPFEGGEFLISRPPHDAAAEAALFKELGVDLIVAKNAGGPASGKLVAARRMGLPVVMIDRPAPPDAPRAETVAAALDWVAGL